MQYTKSYKELNQCRGTMRRAMLDANKSLMLLTKCQYQTVNKTRNINWQHTHINNKLNCHWESTLC